MLDRSNDKLRQFIAASAPTPIVYGTTNTYDFLPRHQPYRVVALSAIVGVTGGAQAQPYLQLIAPGNNIAGTWALPPISVGMAATITFSSANPHQLDLAGIDANTYLPGSIPPDLVVLPGWTLRLGMANATVGDSLGTIGLVIDPYIGA